MSDRLSKILETLSDNQTIRTAEQIREIKPVEEWLESPFYCGIDGAKNIYDVWKGHIADIFKGQYSEVIFTGSLASGKTTCATYCLIRKIYELSCYEHIPRLFEMMDSTIILFLVFSVTLNQAEKTAFGKIRRIIDEIPYFQKYYPRNKRKNTTLEFRDVSIGYASDEQHQIGTDLCGSILDEANFLGKDKSHIIEYDKATKLYTAITNRRLGRFVINKKDMGLSIVVSSAADPTSFVENRIMEADELKARAQKEDPNALGPVYVANVAAFETIEKRKHLAEAEFCVFTGTDIVAPCIIDENDDLQRILVGLGYDIDSVDWRYDLRPIIEHQLSTDTAIKFKFPSESLRRQAEGNLEQFVKDSIGKAIVSDLRLFKNRSLFKEACEQSPENHFPFHRNPFLSDEIILSLKDLRTLDEYFDPKFEFPHTGVQRYIHVDQAVTRDEHNKVQNRLGLACAHISKFEKVNGVVMPFVEIDFLIAITPPERGDEIPFYKIREFIVWLKQVKGLHLGKVTYDSFESRDSMQTFTRMGVPSERYSLDRTDEDWMTLLTLYYERRIKHPYYKTYAEELFALEHDTKQHKVDHATGRFKDVSDAVCGAAANALAAPKSLGAYHIQQLADEHKTPETWDALVYNAIKGAGKKGQFVLGQEKAVIHIRQQHAGFFTFCGAEPSPYDVCQQIEVERPELKGLLCSTCLERYNLRNK